MPANERDDLRRDLFDGDWRRLTDPHLAELTRRWPRAWPKIVRHCAQALALDVLEEDPEPMVQLRAWARTQASDGALREVEDLFHPHPRGRDHLDLLIRLVTPLVSEEHRPGAVLELTKLVVALHPSVERKAALAVLERWPA